MNADAFRHFYDYHFAENRKIWDTYITPLSQEQFLQPSTYSVGSVRNQIVHLMTVDNNWFSELRGIEYSKWLNFDDLNDRSSIRAQWDIVEQNIRAYLASLRDDMLSQNPFPKAKTKT